MPTRDEVRTRVLQLASDIFDLDPDEISEGKDLVADLGASSVMRLEYLVMLERQFAIKFDVSRIEASGRLSEVIDLVMEHLARQVP
jgi:acyl carrier protein